MFPINSAKMFAGHYETRYNFRNHPFTRDIKMEKAQAKRNRRARRNLELMERANAKSN